VAILFLLGLLSPASAAAPDPANAAWLKVRADGVAAEKKRDYLNAERLLREAVQRATKFGGKDERLMATLNDLGNLYATERKYDDSRIVFSRVLTLSEAKYGKSNAALIGPLNNVVRVTCAGGKCSDTTGELKRLLQIRQSSGDAYVRDVPVTLLLLGEAYEQQQKYFDSIFYFKQATSAQARLTSELSKQTIQLSLNLARVYQKMSKFNEAESVCKEALREEEKVCQPNDQLVTSTLSRYRAILEATGRKEEAAKLHFR
jgi:tetratricopeptide (TPR) repeat protein